MFVSKSSRGFLVLAMMFRAAMWKTSECAATSSRTSAASVTDPSTNWAPVGIDSALPGEQVIEDRHARAHVDKPPDESPADEARATGDQDTAPAQGSFGRERHRFTPNRRRTAGRKSRHQS